MGQRTPIFEARDAIGGTWDLFRYPGIRSDSDMYTLGYSFRPWDGEKSIADGAVDPAVHQGHRGRGRHRRAHPLPPPDRRGRLVERRRRAGTSPPSAPTPARPIELTCGFLFSCSGYYRYDHGYQPDFAGIDDFAGTVVHPQHWPEDLDYAGKRVVVIGSGATAVTLIPSLADDAEHVTMLQRSPTYIVVGAGQRTRSPTCCARCCPSASAGRSMRWIIALGTQALVLRSASGGRSS